MSLAIHVRGLRKRFGEFTAVDGIDLDVERGECVGMLGPNGAGKTTTIEILEGIQEPSEGEVEILGMRYGKQGEEIRRRIGIQLQETQLYGKFSVEETVRTFRSFYDRQKDVEDVLKLVDLGEKRATWIEKLSGGQKQRLALACALVGDPELLFLDEPSTGLDPAARRGVWQIVQNLKAEKRTILITTHYMEEAEVLCDRLVIVNRGKIIAQGTPRQLIDALGASEIIEIETEPTVEPTMLESIEGVVKATKFADRTQLTVQEVHRVVPRLLDELRGKGIELRGLTTRHATLDDVFLAHTGTTIEGADSAVLTNGGAK